MNSRTLSVVAILISIGALLIAVNAHTRLDESFAELGSDTAMQIEQSSQEALDETRSSLTQIQTDLENNQDFTVAADQVAILRANFSENFRMGQAQLDNQLSTLESELRANSANALDTLQNILNDLEKNIRQ